MAFLRLFWNECVNWHNSFYHGIGVLIVHMMESQIPSVLLCANYLTKSKGEIDHYTVVKNCIFCRKVHLSFASFILSILTFFYTFLKGVVSEPDWIIWLTKIWLVALDIYIRANLSYCLHID